MRKAILVLLLLNIPCSAQTPEPSFFLAGMEIRIGMPQSFLIERLSSTHKINEMSKDNYLIIGKDIITQDYEVIGNLIFKGGKLHFASKSWFSESPGSTEGFVEALYSVVSQFEKRGETMGVIETGQLREPGVSIRSVTFNSGRRWVTVSLMEQGKTKTVQIDEYISTKPKAY